MAVPQPPLKGDAVAGDVPRIIHSLVGFPITGLLGTAPRAVATHNLLQWFLDRPDIRPRHASIAPLVRRMVLTVSHNVFGPVGVVLQERNGADGIHTSVERHNHRPPLIISIANFAISDQTRS